ncbi:siderophore-interacting protein [Shigella flexneri]
MQTLLPQPTLTSCRQRKQGIVWPVGPRPPSRDDTPLYDELRDELAIRFLIHDGGVASGWAMRRNRAINLRWQVRAVGRRCRKITRISCMSAMSLERPHCAAAWKC